MNNILLIIDVQQGFQRNQETQLNAKKIEALVKLNLFDKIISTKFINNSDLPYYKWLHWPRLFNAPDTNLLDILNDKSDYIIEKHYYNCERNSFINTLKLCNDNEMPTRVFICGTDTDCCVQINATTLFELGIHPLVLVDYCASNGGIESHKAGLTVMIRTLGVKHLIHGDINSKEQIADICAKLED